MKDVTDLSAIEKIDPENTHGSVDNFITQCQAAWSEVNQIKIDSDFSNINNLVFCGMGASIYGALVIKALQGLDFKYPLEIITDYHLPSYVSEKTLVVLTSYSGSTEEVLSCADEAKAMNARILILTKGGKLAEFAEINQVPAYIFNDKENPSRVPRLGAGYTILGLIGLLNKAGIITVGDRRIETALTRLEEKKNDLKSQALFDFELLVNKTPIVIGAEHLSGNTQILRNQFNETSKTFSTNFLVPDLNHHLMEGLKFPSDDSLFFLIFNSPNYSPKIKKRIELTLQVIKDNGHEAHEFMASGQTLYDDFLEVLIYGNYLSLFLALRYDQNPAINPWVDWFKEKLKE